MALSSLSPMQRAAPRVNFDTDRLRTLIAEYIGVDAKRVTDEAHFSDDLGLDWFDRLELMILIGMNLPKLRFQKAMPVRSKSSAILSVC